MQCRICNAKDPARFLSLGTTPLANSLLTAEQLDSKENKYPLELGFCRECSLVQLLHVIPPEQMFSDYVYVTSTTKTFQDHFSLMGETLTKDLGIPKSSLVVDIGSNDGLLLKSFQRLGMRVIGVEPAANIARIASADGVPTINDFFNASVVSQIVEKQGKAHIVTANNVFAHVNDILSFVTNTKALLQEDGYFVIEVQYMADMLRSMTFDNVYHEHLSYYTLHSLKYFFEKHAMKIVDVQKVDTHGGSIRVFVHKLPNKASQSKRVQSLLEEEKLLGADKLETYMEFAAKVYKLREKLVGFLKDIKTQGKLIAGYGFPAKANTILNFCGIGKETISYICEDNPLKQNMFAPGSHIPIVPPAKLREQLPDYILILAWNFAPEIMSKVSASVSGNYRFIISLPEPKII